MLNNSPPRDTKVLEQTYCPFEECLSSDAFTIYEHVDDGTISHGHCYSCGQRTKDPYGAMERSTKTFLGLTPHPLLKGYPPSVKGLSNSTFPQVRSTTTGVEKTQGAYGVSGDNPGTKLSVEEGLVHPIRPIEDRKITLATAERYGVRMGVSSIDGESPIYFLFPRYSKDNHIVGWHQRLHPERQWIIHGGQDVQLFGQSVQTNPSKKLWITEGQFDCLSLYQVLKENSTLPDWEPSVVSLPNGATSAAKAITNNLDFINSFEEVILVYDTDEAGRKARDESCKILAGKVSFVELPLKDANDMLMAGRGRELKWTCLTGSKKYQPDGVLNAKDAWDRYTEKKKDQCFPYPSTMKSLNEHTYGARPGSIITITSGTGSGKSTFLKELAYHYWKTTDEKIAGMFLEEDASDTIKGLLSLDLGKRIHLPDVSVTPDEERASFDKLFGDGRISLYDYFGGMDDGTLLSKLRYFAVTGHKFIFLDHLSIVVSEYAAQGGERERIDTLMTKLAKFVKEFNIVLFLVVHLRKSDSSSNSFELGARPSLDDLRGSGSLKQLSWDVIGLSRNQQHEDSFCANTTEVSVLKCRFTGRTGTADYLHYSGDTGRLLKVEKPLNYRKKRGSMINQDDEF